MKRILLLFTTVFFFISCSKESKLIDVPKGAGEKKVELKLSLDIGFELQLSSNDPNPGYTTEETFSEFEHVFGESVNLLFTSNGSNYVNTLTFNPNDLSASSVITIPYGSYTWSIEDNAPEYPREDYLYRDYLPIFGSGTIDILEPVVSLDLTVDTEFGLVTIEENHVTGAKIINSNEYEKSLTLKDGHYYVYALEGDNNKLEVQEDLYNTTISLLVNDTGVIEARKHYNYILALSDVDVNTITLEAAPFAQIDFFLGPEYAPIYLDDNGVTVKARENAVVGATYELDGVEYLVVDEEMLRYMAVDWRNNDLSKVVTTRVTDMNGLFYYAAAGLNGWDDGYAQVNKDYPMYEGLELDHFAEFNQDISSWDVSNVEYFFAAFMMASSFNSDISKWDLSSALYLRSMFNMAEEFNQPIGIWDISNVISTTRMFRGAKSFNQELGAWDVSNVKHMLGMFEGHGYANPDDPQATLWIAPPFNKPINNWNTSSVEGMQAMFSWNTSFQQDLNSWNTSSVTNMSNMFQYSSYNGDISGWNVSNVDFMDRMFYANTSFQQDLSGWNVGNVTSMQSMFHGTSFNGDISGWNVSNVTNMNSMFRTSSFNGDISGWNVGNVENMNATFFDNTVFNQDISAWDVSKVLNMDSMFRDATGFNQDLSGWCVQNFYSGSPYLFSEGSSLITQNLPNWGNCPSGSDLAPAPSLDWIYTNDNTPSISGTAQAGLSVSLLLNGQTYVTTADNGNIWGISIDSPMDDGEYTMEVWATDSSGNESQRRTATLLIDTIIPEAPVVDSASTTTVKGTAEAGTTVYVYSSDGNDIIGASGTDQNGNFTVNLSPEQSIGAIVYVTSRDYVNESERTQATVGN